MFFFILESPFFRPTFKRSAFGRKYPKFWFENNQTCSRPPNSKKYLWAIFPGKKLRSNLKKSPFLSFFLYFFVFAKIYLFHFLHFALQRTKICTFPKSNFWVPQKSNFWVRLHNFCHWIIAEPQASYIKYWEFLTVKTGPQTISRADGILFASEGSPKVKSASSVWAFPRQILSDPPPWFDPSPRSDLPHSAHLSLEKKCTSAQTNIVSRPAPTQNPPWMTNAQIQINDMFFV